MGREDQIEEREILDFIFPDEITDISETEFRIQITLDIPNYDPRNAQPIMYVSVRYPPDYPDKAPDLDLLPADDNAMSRHSLFSVADDKGALLDQLAPTIEENLGMAMVYTLVTTLKEEAEKLVVSRCEVAARQREETALATEREENKKFQGTPVTRDTFLQWRDGFWKEMEEARVREEEEQLPELKKVRMKELAKMTGRQLWESGLAKGEKMEKGVDDDAVVEVLGKLKIAA